MDDRNEAVETTNGTLDGAENTSDEKIAELEQAIAEGRDQLLRRTAEMDNMRRRHLQEREQLIFEGNKRLIADLLSVVDDLERTLEHASEEKDPLTQGIEL